jgi:hypothetical protein
MTALNGRSQAVENQFQVERQRRLSALNRQRLCPALPDPEWRTAVIDELPLLILEGEYVEEMRARVAARVAELPRDPEGFMAWLAALEQHGPGQHDPLFDYLAEGASLEEMRWFLEQEVAGEAGFEDLVALTQIRLPVRAKLELARNYWDGPMLARLAAALDLHPDPQSVVWESLALSNLLVALAHHRRYAYQSIGALGVIELTAPGRAIQVNAGLQRLEVDGKLRHYFALHSTLDVRHSLEWNREIIAPLIADRPELASAIAEGALMRLDAGARCFERYRRAFGLAFA